MWTRRYSLVLYNSCLNISISPAPGMKTNTPFGLSATGSPWLLLSPLAPVFFFEFCIKFLIQPGLQLWWHISIFGFHKLSARIACVGTFSDLGLGSGTAEFEPGRLGIYFSRIHLRQTLIFPIIIKGDVAI